MNEASSRAHVAIALRTLGDKPKVVVDVLRSDGLPTSKDEFRGFLADYPRARTATTHRTAASPIREGDVERAWDAADRVLETCAKAGISALAFGDPGFPERIASLQSRGLHRSVSLGGFCPLLYCRGPIDALNSKRAVAIIGSREPTPYGRDHACEFGLRLASEGIVIVSGLARGCDTEAHIGCVRANGAGVGVMAHGLDRVYPPENADLADRLIASNGCLVSEYPPGTPPNRRAFGFRDRIQAGLADLVIVVETPAKDGTLITVDFARKQGRRIGCLSHPAEYTGAPQIAGNARLLRDGSAPAAPLREPGDALNALLAAQRDASTTDGNTSTPRLPLRW